MGFRNPFRIGVDQKTGWVLMADYGPDAGATEPEPRPAGHRRVEHRQAAGQLRLAVLHPRERPVQRLSRSRPAPARADKFNCAAPVNNSPNNTGLTNLPPAQPGHDVDGLQRATRCSRTSAAAAPRWAARATTSTRPATSDRKLPRVLRRQGVHRRVEQRLDQDRRRSTTDGDSSTASPAAPSMHGLHAARWTSSSARTARCTSSSGARASAATTPTPASTGSTTSAAPARRSRVASGDTDAGRSPLTVQFSSAGSSDPDGHGAHLRVGLRRRHADVDRGRTRSHTYTAAGNYNATLTVTDAVGRYGGRQRAASSSATQRPVVTIEIPEDGQVRRLGRQGPVHGDRRPTPRTARSTATRSRSSSSSATTTHAHELSNATGCEGTFRRSPARGHGVDANIFTVIEASYTDAGNGRRGAAHRPRRGDPAAQAQAGRVLRHTGRAADGRGSGDPGVADGGDHRRRRRPEHRLHRGRRLDLVQPVQPRGHRPRSRSAWPPAARAARIELRYDAADGPLVGRDAEHRADRRLADVARRHDRPAGDQSRRARTGCSSSSATRPRPASLMNLNWFKFTGKGAAVTAPPEVTATAEPVSGAGAAERGVQRHGDRRRGRGADLRRGTSASPAPPTDTSTQEDPNYTYTAPGNYTATRHGDRRRRRQVQRHGRGPRHAAARRVPDGPGALGRVRRHRARPRTAGPCCGRTRPTRSASPTATSTCRSPTARCTGPGTTREEHHRPADA